MGNDFIVMRNRDNCSAELIFILHNQKQIPSGFSFKCQFRATEKFCKRVTRSFLLHGFCYMYMLRHH